MPSKEMEQLSRSRRVRNAKVDITDIVIRVVIGKLVDQLEEDDRDIQLTCRKRSILHEECSGPAPSNP